VTRYPMRTMLGELVYTARRGEECGWMTGRGGQHVPIVDGVAFPRAPGFILGTTDGARMKAPNSETPATLALFVRDMLRDTEPNTPFVEKAMAGFGDPLRLGGGATVSVPLSFTALNAKGRRRARRRYMPNSQLEIARSVVEAGFQRWHAEVYGAKEQDAFRERLESVTGIPDAFRYSLAVTMTPEQLRERYPRHGRAEKTEDGVEPEPFETWANTTFPRKP
jgi:hypothetical protein